MFGSSSSNLGILFGTVLLSTKLCFMLRFVVCGATFIGGIEETLSTCLSSMALIKKCCITTSKKAPFLVDGVLIDIALWHKFEPCYCASH